MSSFSRPLNTKYASGLRGTRCLDKRVGINSFHGSLDPASYRKVTQNADLPLSIYYGRQGTFIYADFVVEVEFDRFTNLETHRPSTVGDVVPILRLLRMGYFRMSGFRECLGSYMEM